MKASVVLAAFRLDRALLKRMKALKKRDGVSQSVQVREALAQYLAAKDCLRCR